MGIIAVMFLADRLMALLLNRLLIPPEGLSDLIRTQLLCAHTLLGYVFYISTMVFLKNKEAAYRIRDGVQDAFSGLGLAIGIVALCLVLTPELYYRRSSFQMIAWEDIWLPLLTFIGGAISEEMVFRGFLQRVLCAFLPSLVATVIQVALFVASHESSIVGDSAPIFRIVDLSCYSLLATMMARKSPYLILPIVFHFGMNLFNTLIIGEHHQWDVPAMWTYSDSLRVQYQPIIMLAICTVIWYRHASARKINPATHNTLTGHPS